MVKELDKEYFYDRVLARTALKYSQTLEELTMYQDDDEVAAKLYELHGPEAWSWDHMSERLRKKYNIC